MNFLKPGTPQEETGEAEPTRTDDQPPQRRNSRGGHGRWMMIACCVPMLGIAVLIAASGAGFGFLVVAIGCTLMMALMVGSMSGGGGKDGEER